MKILTNSVDCMPDEEKELYLSWNDMKWEIVGEVQEYLEDKTNMCKDSDGLTTIILPTYFSSLEICSQTCQKIHKAQVPIVLTVDSINNLQYKLSKFSLGSGPGMGVFLSITANDDGHWIDQNSGDIVDISHLDVGEYRCMLLNSKSPVNFPCNFGKGKLFTLDISKSSIY